MKPVEKKGDNWNGVLGRFRCFVQTGTERQCGDEVRDKEDQIISERSEGLRL